MKPKEKVCLISLGCAKNLVDSENILGLLKERGHPLVSDPDDAECVVINTCGFVQAAVEESIDTILDICARKKKGVLKRVYGVGCFVQRYGYKLLKEIPEVDGWLGTGEIHRIGDLLEGKGAGPIPFHLSRPTFLADHNTPRVQTTPFYTAYLKIGEGCSHRCSYCLIPGLTGPFRSRGMKSLVLEAQGMADRGVKEVNLVAQDTTSFGEDLDGHVRLEDLIEALLKITGLRWIRVLYSHPFRITDRLLSLLYREEALCPYLDIPFQHVHPGVLKAMGRNPGGQDPYTLLERIRSGTRRLTLRTTLMVGFPGETEKAFEELHEFVARAAFDHLGAFVFSPERGTPAARLKNAVPREEAERRRHAVMSLQAEISRKKNQEMVNRTIPVLVEGLSPETDLLLKGRTAGMAPDVDGQVLINRGEAGIGDIVPVLIRDAHPYDLVGEIL